MPCCSLATLLEQSGQRSDGYHLPDIPQLHTAYGGKGRVKSHSLLQNGLHMRPKIQSSHALAPFLGGGHSIQSFTMQKKKKSFSFLIFYISCNTYSCHFLGLLFAGYYFTTSSESFHLLETCQESIPVPL